MKTISIRGKNYIPVSERIKEFHALHPNGRIVTELAYEGEEIVRAKATVWPDVKNLDRYFTGHAEERRDNKHSMVNAVSASENCETSAIGRSLGIMGIGILDGIASADEVVKATNARTRGVRITADIDPTRDWMSEARAVTDRNKALTFLEEAKKHASPEDVTGITSYFRQKYSK